MSKRTVGISHDARSQCSAEWLRLNNLKFSNYPSEALVLATHKANLIAGDAEEHVANLLGHPDFGRQPATDRLQPCGVRDPILLCGAESTKQGECTCKEQRPRFGWMRGLEWEGKWRRTVRLSRLHHKHRFWGGDWGRLFRQLGLWVGYPAVCVVGWT
jgi:hypothetical protein